MILLPNVTGVIQRSLNKWDSVGELKKSVLYLGLYLTPGGYTYACVVAQKENK